MLATKRKQLPLRVEYPADWLESMVPWPRSDLADTLLDDMKRQKGTRLKEPQVIGGEDDRRQQSDWGEIVLPLRPRGTAT